jgi:hypothetical protein
MLPKLMREWTVLFTEGKPLFEPAPPVESTEPTPEQILEQERQKLLDETDFMEYKVSKIYILKKEIEHNIFTTCRIPQSLTNSVT